LQILRPAGNEPAVICFLWIGHIVDDVTDRPTLCAAFADMKRHDSCSCHKKPSSQNIFSELFVPIVEINSPYGYNIKKLPIPQRRDFMIEQLIAEATECDFKVALEIKKPKSWLKSVSSFSNGIGGTLFFGISDDRKPIGLSDVQKDAEAISRLIKERITPLPQFILKPLQEDGKNLLALEVSPGRSTPYYYKADGVMEAYIRVGNESVIAPDYIVNELILKGTNQSFDTLTTDAVKKDYSFTLLEATYLERTGLRFEPSDYVSFGLTDKNGLLTNAGKLMTDQHTVYNSRMFCTRWNGFEKGSIFDDALDDKEYEGNLIYLLNSGSEFIRNNSKVRFVKKAQYRVDKPDYAERAVTEALVNALIHRDYIVLGSEIHIDMFDDRVEITSPGGMFGGGSIQEYDIYSIRSMRRNPVIADLFHRMKYMERRGSGLRKIVSETEKLPGYTEAYKPEFSSTATDFRVILKNVNYIMCGASAHDTAHDAAHDTSVISKQNLLLEFCADPKSRDEMQAYIDVSSRSHFSKYYLKPLLSSGKLEMMFPDKPKSKNQKYTTVHSK
jgi:ATP-dependent DNA helicase RecG